MYVYLTTPTTEVDYMKRQPMFLTAAISISFILLLSACGQSGPLYVPGDPSQMAVPPAQNPAVEGPAVEDDVQEENEPSTTE